MNKKTARRKRDLKTKLLAAVAMLLVSSLMMVTTTYAWFTLSTAPEVTGITTAVGANGNLEMALLPLNGNNETRENSYGVTTGTSDSMAVKSAQEANITWGNLVDLSNFYGLEGVTLFPSELSTTTTDGKTYIATDGASILKTPTYGADGRIASLVANTVSGVFQDGKAVQSVVVDSNTVDDPTGVRLLGTVSGMSDRQLDFRNALSMANAAARSAESAARGALETNGDALGAIAVKYATDNTTATESDRQALLAMVNALQGTGSTKGALDYIEEGIRQYIYAYQISISATEDGYLGLKAQIVGDGTTAPTSTLAELQTANLAPDAFDEMIAKLAESRAAVAEAQGDLGTETDQLSNLIIAMSPLVNVQNMTINGMAVYVDGALNSELEQKILDDFLASKGITLAMPSGSGVFADVSDFIGNYGATIGVPASAVLPESTATISASMTTAAISPTYFANAKEKAEETAIQGGDDASKAISDFYGYVIDLAFRTNAANSSLRLQTSAVDRIYNNTENQPADDSTMGGGATLTFTSNDAANGFDNADVIALMEHVRIVFFDPSQSNLILGYGVTDGTATTVDGKITVGLKMATKPNPESDADYIPENKIMDLEQNKAHRLSVLVYLDGASITNADVAIGAETSMSGSLNLQFSSSADLEPMKYTDFEALDGATTPSTPAAPTPVELNNTVNISGDGATGVSVGTNKWLVEDKIVIELSGVTSGQTVDVQIGEGGAESATVQQYSTYTAVVVDAPDNFTNGTGDITITVPSANP